LIFGLRLTSPRGAQLRPYNGELGFSFVDVVNSIQTRHGMGD
jgi:hypothetical protein